MTELIVKEILKILDESRLSKMEKAEIFDSNAGDLNPNQIYAINRITEIYNKFGLEDWQMEAVEDGIRKGLEEV